MEIRNLTYNTIFLSPLPNSKSIFLYAHKIHKVLIIIYNTPFTPRVHNFANLGKIREKGKGNIIKLYEL